jgi:hypothetical protein
MASYRQVMTSALAFVFLGSLASAAETATRVDRPPEKGAPGEEQPLLALWRQYDGMYDRSEAPYLRFAIWNDGRVLYAKNPDKWGHDLLRGKISPTRVARLKTALAATGVFDLKGTCYLVPDAPKDCLMVDLGDKQQMLCWDEVEAPNYGINYSPEPQHLEFKRCWKVINYLALVALPDEGETVTKRFQVPESWYLKRAVQSE